MSKALDRLTKLITQADRAPEGSPERQLFTDKAVAMSQAIGVDLAVARARQANKEKVEQPERRQIKVGQYGSKTQSRLNGFLVDLFLRIAAPNDVDCTIGGTSVYVYAHGFPSDIDVCEKLFAMLSVHMVSEADRLLKAGANKHWVEDAILHENDSTYIDWRTGFGERVTKRDDDGNVVRGRALRSKVDGRVWRANFYEGFISNIGSRLYEARRDEVKRRKQEEGDESSSTEVALRDKAKEVADFYRQETEHMVLGSWEAPSTSMTSYHGQDTGRSVAAKAALGDETGVDSGSDRRAL